MQVNVHEAKTQLSRLLELIEQGEKVTIARHGKPVAELVRVRSSRFALGAGRGDFLVPPGRMVATDDGAGGGRLDCRQVTIW